MKNYIYIFILFLICSAVFVMSCQKEKSSSEVLTPNTTDLSEMRWYENCECGDDYGGCYYLCLGEGGCCCEITWEFLGSEPFPTGQEPYYCKAWDINHSCTVACTSWDGVRGELCPSRFDEQPYSLWPTYLCVPQNTAFSLRNSSATHYIEITVNCSGSPNPPTYTLDPSETITIDITDCEQSINCRF